MATQKKRYPLAQAEAVANELVKHLAPACVRIEAAGSIRRQAPSVHDIELLAISKEQPAFLADRPRLGYILLDMRVDELIAKGILDYRLNKRGFRTYGRLNKLLVHTPSGISVALFSTTVENFGMAWVVRTGPAGFTVRLMARFKHLGFKGHAYAGVKLADGTQVPCPTEEKVFELAGWPCRAPEERG